MYAQSASIYTGQFSPRRARFWTLCDPHERVAHLKAYLPTAPTRPVLQHAAMSSSKLASQETWQKTLNDIFDVSDDDFDNLFNSIWAPEIEATIDGITLDHTNLSAHLKRLRDAVGPGDDRIKVIYLFRDGERFASRHSASATLKDGRETRTQGYVFGELNSKGLIRKFDEAVIIDGAHPLKDAAE